MVGADSDLSAIERLADRYWIVGRIRLDARAELADRLSLAPASDALLCLHAYAAWGEDFLKHLAGDFCFVLWDEPEQRLVSVRDQLGVRSLFWTEAGGTVFVSDRLDWVAARPGLGRELDEAWIADFLVANVCADLERTVYRDIRRVAPAHALVATEGGMTTRRYWRLAVDEPIFFRDRRHYGERFRELLGRAVTDRLPPGRVGVSMSGGLDSTTLAAAAVEVTGDPGRVVAMCDHFERLMADEEGRFSALVARHLGIELELRAIDDLVYDPHWRERSPPYSEPSLLVVSAGADRLAAREMAGRASVWLYGEGPDNALALDRDAYLSWLARRGEWLRLTHALLQYAAVKGRRGWMATLHRHLGRAKVPSPHVGVPAWLDAGLTGRLDVAGRLARLDEGEGPAHPWHPAAMASFGGPAWQRALGDLECDEMVAGFAWRHPFLDLRVLQFMLSVPPVPWAWEKELLRDAMRDRLPAEVLARRKTPLAQWPLAGKLREHGLPDLSSNRRLGPYVDVARLSAAQPSDAELWSVLAVHALDHWLEAHRA